MFHYYLFRLMVERRDEADKLNNLMNRILITRNLSPQHYMIQVGETFLCMYEKKTPQVLENEEVQIVRKTSGLSETEGRFQVRFEQLHTNIIQC